VLDEKFENSQKHSATYVKMLDNHGVLLSKEGRYEEVGVRIMNLM